PTCQGRRESLLRHDLWCSSTLAATSHHWTFRSDGSTAPDFLPMEGRLRCTRVMASSGYTTSAEQNRSENSRSREGIACPCGRGTDASSLNLSSRGGQVCSGSVRMAVLPPSD